MNKRTSYPVYIKDDGLLRLSHCLTCLLVLLSLVNCATVSARTADGVHDQGNYTIPLPVGWRAGGSGAHSFYQSDSGGCFNSIDQDNGEYLARFCTSEQPLESVPARAQQAVARFGQGLEHEVRTTPNGAVYHTLSKNRRVVFIFLEGRDYLLNIEIEAEARRQKEVAAKVVAILDQVVWRPVAPGSRRLAVDEASGPGSAGGKGENVDDAVAMVCEGEVFDLELLTKAIQHRQLDLAAKCPADGRILLEHLSFAPASDWSEVLALVPDIQRQMLLNLRLAAIGAILKNNGPEDTTLRQLDLLASAGAQPVTQNGAVDSSTLNAFLLWGHGDAEDPRKTGEAVKILLKLIDNLAAFNSKPPELAYQFWGTLLKKDTIHQYPDQKWQLLILDRLQQRFGAVAPAAKEDELSPLQYAISDAPLPVVEAVAKLTSSDAVSPGVLVAAIERDRWQILTALRKIDLGHLSDSDYRSVLVAASRKTLASGDVDHLHRLLSARQAGDSSLDWLLGVALNAYQEEFASFGWKTVEYLQQAGASPERVMTNAGEQFYDPCRYMLSYPERFRGLVERGFDIGTPLPVTGRKETNVNTLMLFFMCRDPRSSILIQSGPYEDLGKAMIQHAKPDLLNTYSKASNVFPLVRAAERSITLARMMLDAGADPNAQDSYGNTMLMMAAAGNELEVVRFLLSAGADVNRKNRTGINALGYADCFDAKDVLTVLQTRDTISEGADVCRKIARKAQ